MKFVPLLLFVVFVVATMGTVDAYMGGYGYGGCGSYGYGNSYGGYGMMGYRPYFDSYQRPYARMNAPVGMMSSPWW